MNTSLGYAICYGYVVCMFLDPVVPSELNLPVGALLKKKNSRGIVYCSSQPKQIQHFSAALSHREDFVCFHVRVMRVCVH